MSNIKCAVSEKVKELIQATIPVLLAGRDAERIVPNPTDQKLAGSLL
jgi:hypothetical protein